MKKCTSCQLEIDDKATKCPHCQSFQPVKINQSVYIVLVVLVVFYALLFRSCTKILPKAQNDVTTAQAIIPTPAPSKEAAQKELDSFMTLSKNAGIVISYEFSNKATVVKVSNAWYKQDTAFKQDFLAKVAMLKHATTGFKHFEVRNSKSNEKVAEVTAFGGALEVYK